MKVLIVEDEGIAAERLSHLVEALDQSVTIVGVLDSVKSVIRWFEDHEQPDLIFLDIQLADGLSFEIFEKVQVTSPIIFTTAYDQYAIKAFTVNSIDYLLKPIVQAELERAWAKFKSQVTKILPFDPSKLLELIQTPTKKYKERFVIKVGEHLKSVLMSETELFYTEEKTTYVQLFSGHKYILDQSLDQVESLIDPTQFFRINRKYIVHIDRIKDILAYSNSRLKLSLMGSNASDLIVARERVVQFKSWLDR